MRLSFGIIPNIGSISTSSYGAGLQSITNYQGPQVPTFGTAAYAGSTITGLVPNSPGNPNLKIERIQKSNIGIDFSVWNGRARRQYKGKAIERKDHGPTQHYSTDCEPVGRSRSY